MSAEPHSNLRKWRKDRDFSLDHVCDLLKLRGFDRPSAAKLSRIERDQDIPLEMIPALEAVTGIPAKELRPDLAKIFDGESAA